MTGCNLVNLQTLTELPSDHFTYFSLSHNDIRALQSIITSIPTFAPRCGPTTALMLECTSHRRASTAAESSCHTLFYNIAEEATCRQCERAILTDCQSSRSIAAPTPPGANIWRFAVASFFVDEHASQRFVDTVDS